MRVLLQGVTLVGQVTTDLLSLQCAEGPGVEHHQVIGVGLLKEVCGLCFDDNGVLYVAGREGVARFRPDPAQNGIPSLFAGFLCRSVHAQDGAPVGDGAVMLPAAAKDVSYSNGVFVVSAHEYAWDSSPAGLWVMDAQGTLLKHINTKVMDNPTYLALRQF